MQSMQTKNAVPDRPHGILVSWANKRLLLQTQEFAISNCKQPLLAVESQSRVWHCAAEFSLGSVIGLPDLTCLPG